MSECEMNPSVTRASSEWDRYWQHQNSGRRLYGQIASLYRRRVIAPSLRRTLAPLVCKGEPILHIGAGSGELDVLLPASWNLTSLDFSSEALRKHRVTHQRQARESKAVQGDMFRIPFADSSFKVAFNLGVMEHLNETELVLALENMWRVTKVGGSIVLYWPPVWGPTVVFLHLLARLLRLFREAPEQLHPPEINLLRSRRTTHALLQGVGFRDVKFSYGIGDLFTHVIVTARKS